jgi:chromosomal replication initiation ATPase DnaA
VFVAGTGNQTPSIRTTATAFSFNASTGNLVVPGDVTAFSDSRLKENVFTITNALEKVCALRGVEFNRIDIEGNPKHLGLIAQEVEKILPEVVHSTISDGTELKVVSYMNIIAVLVEAIKEQQQEINNIKEMFGK